ncbi:WLM-domain-containing protein [Coprinopsis marcescibilis]|uniref:WLM-domain-containing protein n=1 Tax=Coprinopsis marcescibilis TaxID=230819 RepID=A0A5C3L5V5_COPMA|nr:WLM-domain-containing protein [Coprinopsis marcescibilis]
MVHVRINETESNPNPHVNFITALPSVPEIQQESLHLLRALVAQVKPIMKKHGFSVNSLEEYEYNRVFAGRNWNHGETVEIVLRRPGGDIYPTSWLMGTLCHELAHIKHMNHGSDFQALWRQLRTEVRELQNRGYYGDGYWSSGQRVADSARVSGAGIDSGEFPEFMCGGAQQRSQPTARRRRIGVPRGKRKEVTPSLHTGRQTARKRKAGGRVTSKYAFTGEGQTVGGGDPDEGKGKRAASNCAREERALAAERRLKALAGGSESSGSAVPPLKEEEDDAGSDDEQFETVGETDAERREYLISSKQDKDDNESLGSGKYWSIFEKDFNFSKTADSDKPGPSRLPAAGPSRLGIGKLVQAEIQDRKKEALGLAPIKGKRTIGQKPRERSPPVEPEGWGCLVCTLINSPQHLACSACATPRGETTCP